MNQKRGIRQEREMSSGPASYTRREWLLIRALQEGADWLAADEAVASTAMAHLEWNMDETRTWDQWERDDQGEIDGMDRLGQRQNRGRS